MLRKIFGVEPNPRPEKRHSITETFVSAPLSMWRFKDRVFRHCQVPSAGNVAEEKKGLKAESNACGMSAGSRLLSFQQSGNVCYARAMGFPYN